MSGLSSAPLRQSNHIGENINECHSFLLLWVGVTLFRGWALTTAQYVVPPHQSNATNMYKVVSMHAMSLRLVVVQRHR
jgi:hypothetical protein